MKRSHAVGGGGRFLSSKLRRFFGTGDSWKVVPGVADIASEMKEWRHDFHANPELAFQEHRTSQLVAERLESWGIKVTRNVAQTGVVGTLEGKLSPGSRSVGLRADMDALPMEEENDFAHRSTVPGRMHGCGHDGHTTMLLGAAKYLAESRDFAGTVHFIFQPAEEEFGGGMYMVEEGLFERFPCDAIFGMHNWPLMKAGEVSVRTGPIMASADEFNIKIFGKGGHAAMPHLTVDPIAIGATTITALQNVVSRKNDPLKPGVLSVTTFHAGSAHNVIPDMAELQGTIRTLDEETRTDMVDTLKRMTRQVVEGMGGTCEIELIPGYPVTANDSEESEFVASVASSVVGAENVYRNVAPTMGAEDFSYMLQKVPGCYLWLGQGQTDDDPMVHHPLYDFNDDVAPLGSSLLVRIVEEYLEA